MDRVVLKVITEDRVRIRLIFVGVGIEPMHHYIAFLRAINVGSHKVKMARLKEVFESLELSDVQTYINSGNVIFRSAEPAKTLERKLTDHLGNELGFATEPFLRTSGQLQKLAQAIPEADNVHVAFLHAQPDAEAQKKLAESGEKFEFHGNEIFWLLERRFSDSKFSGAKLEKAVGGPATLRSASMIRKLAAKVLDI